MKKLLKYLSPFAPDQSGAVATLFELGGLIVICDAGGCTGNVCGFDEPRWFLKRSAVFSAALRDMDAILGRDQKLVEKVVDAAQSLDTPFTALIGTPVPAVIATDFRALKRMVEKRTSRLCLPISTNGTAYYDEGASVALSELYSAFATESLPVDPTTAAILGATPLDISAPSPEKLLNAAHALGFPHVFCATMGGSLEDVRRAASSSLNLVVSPAGIATARLLQQRFGTPWRTWFPVPDLPEIAQHASVLVIHQQIAANAIRESLEQRGTEHVSVATWFRLEKELARPGDIRLSSEEQFADLANRFDVMIADRHLRHAVPAFQGTWVDVPHFAISGRLEGTP
ncbi:MAG: hypothetical protein IJJ26_00305 [Victivallales bacterium]|nr:hypothetical protein [Victivallales bacterium]